MLAAFLTNGAMVNVILRFRNGRRFFSASEIIDQEEVIEKFKSSTLGTPEKFRSLDTDITKAFTLEMQEPFKAITLCQQGRIAHAKQPSQSTFERPQEFIDRLEGARDSDAESEIFSSLLRTIKELPPAKHEYDVVMSLHPDIHGLDLHRNVRPIPTSATFVLQLIVESYKSWLIPPKGGLNTSNPRLKALRFAQDVHESVVRCLAAKIFEPRPDCLCPDCWNPGLPECLRMFESDLYNFISERRFDLYHQSPVVAGYQMTRILARATNIGTLFACIDQFVGVVLHLYNFLRQFDLINEESVLLENLCDVVGHCIFRGPRPTLNFWNHYAAFQGIARDFDKESRTYSVGVSKTKKKRLFPHGLSIMSGLNDCSFNPCCHRWDPVWWGSDKHRQVTKAVQRTADKISAHPLVCALEPLESNIRPEWEGMFPVARINWFEVYMACTGILEKMTAGLCVRYALEDPEMTHFHLNRDHEVVCGKYRVEDLLKWADKYKRSNPELTESIDVSVAKDTIRETFAGEIPCSISKSCSY